jgi:hypothetical protein
MESMTVETDLFEPREVKAPFINPGCFGEDFARWLKEKLADLVPAGFELSDLIQEDYGWGFWVTHGSNRFWVAVSFCGDGPTEEPAEWVVSVNYDPGLNPLKRLFARPDPEKLASVRDRIWQVLGSTQGIRVITGASD